MTRTIDERIDSVVADLFFKEKITALKIATTLKKHFQEPWLDAPDGPGWWWRRGDYGDTIHDVGKYPETKLHRGKWQRVIPPSD